MTTPEIYKSNTVDLIRERESDPNFLILNTEQLSKPSELKQLLDLGIHRIIDYSLGNIQYLSSHGIVGRYLPYQVDRREIMDLPKTMDICFVGLFHGTYRKKIITALKRAGKNVTVINNLWGEARDKILFRHKILVNIHYNGSYNVLEQLRINRCILNKIIVISEQSSDDDMYYLKSHIISVEYGELVSKAVSYTHLDVYKRQANTQYRLFTESNQNDCVAHPYVSKLQ